MVPTLRDNMLHMCCIHFIWYICIDICEKEIVLDNMLHPCCVHFTYWYIYAYCEIAIICWIWIIMVNLLWIDSNGDIFK